MEYSIDLRERCLNVLSNVCQQTKLNIPIPEFELLDEPCGNKYRGDYNHEQNLIMAYPCLHNTEQECFVLFVTKHVMLGNGFIIPSFVHGGMKI